MRAHSDSDAPEFPPLVRSSWEEDGYTFWRCTRAAWDMRGTEWATYGQSGGSIYYAVSNGRGALSWRVLLGKMLDGTDLGLTVDALHHHYPPSDECANDQNRDCELLAGGKCQGDYGYLIAEPLGQAFTCGGDAAVFAMLTAWCDMEFPP